MSTYDFAVYHGVSGEIKAFLAFFQYALHWFQNAFRAYVVLLNNLLQIEWEAVTPTALKS